MSCPRASIFASVVFVSVIVAPAIAAAAVPERLWATYVAGTNDDRVTGVAVDGAGNVYVCGQTNSTGMASLGAQQKNFGGGESDAIVFKFAPDGKRLWSTYLGGSELDGAHAIAVDAAGNAVVFGSTGSSTMIVTPGALQPMYQGDFADFVVRYDPDGKRVWGTYFADAIEDVAIAPGGIVYLAGVAAQALPHAFPPGTHEPAHNGTTQGFLVRLTAAGQIDWGTYYGGEDMDYFRALALVGAEVYAAGETRSTTGIATVGDTTYAGNSDVFLARFDAAGQRVWGTYIGGEAFDWWSDVAATPEAVYLTMEADSATGIATPGAFKTAPEGGQDGVLARFSPAGELTWATYYGGPGIDDEFLVVAVDAAGNPLIAGGTDSASGIATPNAYLPNPPGGRDLFVAKFDPAGGRRWGSYVGGSNDEYRATIAAVGLDAVHVGLSTNSTGLGTAGAFQANFGGVYDGYLVRLSQGLGDACLSGADCEGGICTDGVCCDKSCGGGDPGDCQACSVAAGAPDDGFCALLGVASICRPAAFACDAPEACSGAATCPEDLVTADDGPCDGGTCLAGECVPEMGTTDTSTSDTSTSDTSTSDTSTSDTSTTDASTTDASTTDASTTDASTTDASTTDASTTSTSTTGTSTTDATSSTTADTTTTGTTTSDTSGGTSPIPTTSATSGSPSTSDGPGSTSTGSTGETGGATEATSEPTQVDPSGCGCRHGEPAPRDISFVLLALLGVRRRRPRLSSGTSHSG